MTEDDPHSLIHLAGRYVQYLRLRHYSQRTVYARTRQLANFRTFCQQIGLTQAREVTRAVILNYQSHLYHHRKRDGQPLTVGTQKQWLGAVVAWFSWLTREGHILYNPASDLELPRKEYRLPKTVLSANEVESILNVPDLGTPIGLRDRAILETLYSTGIRRAELCSLDLRHLDPDMQVIHIEHGKGDKARFVPIGERALKWLDKYLVEVRPKLLPGLNEPALFLNTRGNRLSEQRLGTAVHEIIKQAGIGKSGGCHLFRHAFATVLLKNGCDLRHIQAMLGHSSLETTQIYTHVSITQIQEAHRRYHPAKLPERDADEGTG